MRIHPIQFVAVALIFLLTACSSGVMPMAANDVGDLGELLDGKGPGLGSQATQADEDNGGTDDSEDKEDADAGGSFQTPLDDVVVGPHVDIVPDSTLQVKPTDEGDPFRNAFDHLANGNLSAEQNGKPYEVDEKEVLGE